ncbi:hypothetical protein [Streptomyces sp. KL116D]|uniref:hypothetical protein n=1 Tax=Streptomyces sp. KL116D TaxID=3045152 RepID=UPI003556A349
MASDFVHEVRVIDVEPSALDAGLVDLTVTLWCDDALAGQEQIWDLIRTGQLNRPGMWRALAPEDRRAWLSVALWSHEYQRRGSRAAPAGRCSPGWPAHR